MKKFSNLLITWGIVFLFLIILGFFYNRSIDDNYLYLGEDAPIPTQLHPLVEEKKNILLQQAAESSINLVITDEFRTFEEQDALFERGRTTQGNIVTNARAGETYHNYGLAIDYALINEAGDYIWDTTYDGNNNGISDWFEVAELAKDLGFEWGGDWSGFKDYPHLQMTFGLSIHQLQDGMRPAT
ncbi:M15 family metallopeptidase [Oceanobacillus chungangensis]|uniref:Peptidase n=1 Tax=Oceanobacillus chungangensis TaxID=1229152 RepID=A0A3D8PG22_9BACI|nr:M15 family metallopeptidase [Oceanobacillus chungangensis]RDW15024.1 peptidase [Oceanobacillus chungangensis]